MIDTQADINQKQRNKYSFLLQRVARGEISPNQSYKIVYNDEDPDTRFFGSFKDWIQQAKLNGWLDKVNDIFEDQAQEETINPSISQQQTSSTEITKPILPQKEKNKNGTTYIIIGVGLIATAVFLYTKYHNKKS